MWINMKKLVSVLLCALLAGSCALAGCGGNNSSQSGDSSATEAANSSASASATSGQKQTGTSNTSAQSGNVQSSQGSVTADGSTGISANDAAEAALKQQGSEYRLASCEPGTDESGAAVWVVRLTSDAGKLDYIYYVKKGSCVLAYMDDAEKTAGLDNIKPTGE